MVYVFFLYKVNVLQQIIIFGYCEIILFFRIKFCRFLNECYESLFVVKYVVIYCFIIYDKEKFDEYVNNG